MYKALSRYAVLAAGMLLLLPVSLSAQDPLGGGFGQGRVSEDPSYTVSSGQPSARRSRSWWRFFNRPEKGTPREQLVYCRELEEAGREGKALSELDNLVVTWPDSDEAAYAQLGIARLLEKKGKTKKAFEAYQVLVTEYSGRFPAYDQVLERQFGLARKLMDTRKGKFLFLPGFRAPERAVPLFEDLIRSGPNSPFAPEAQYLVGMAHMENEDYEDAIVAFSTVQQRYPGSSFAEEASYQGGKAFYRIAKEHPHSEADQEKAWAALTLFVQNYPGSVHLQEVERWRADTFGRMAEAAFEQARYYDEIARKPEAALISYRRFAARFPSSEWTDEAQNRIEALEKLVPSQE